MNRRIAAHGIAQRKIYVKAQKWAIWPMFLKKIYENILQGTPPS